MTTRAVGTASGGWIGSSTRSVQRCAAMAYSKAVSVAQRVLFLTSLHIPTQDPDVDKGHDRGERPVPKAGDYRDEALNSSTSVSRLQQMWKEVRGHNLDKQVVVNETGDDEPLGELLTRLGLERRGGAA